MSAAKKHASAEETLKDPSGDIAKLHKIGITDYAIRTYMVRLQEGQPKEAAFRALLHGRSLSDDQTNWVRTVLDRFPVA